MQVAVETRILGWTLATVHESKLQDTKWILQVEHKQSDSAIWPDLLEVKKLYLRERKMTTGNGAQIDFFWQDSWHGNTPLSVTFSDLFEISLDRDKSVTELAALHWNLSFRRWLSPDLQQQCTELRNFLLGVALNDSPDSPRWKFTKSGKLTIKYMYHEMLYEAPYRSFQPL